MKSKLEEIDLPSLQSSMMVLNGILNASNISQNTISEWFSVISPALILVGETLVSTVALALHEITEDPQPETQKSKLEAVCSG